MKFSILIVFLSFSISCSSKHEVVYLSNINNVVETLQQLATIPDALEKESKINAVWDSLSINGLIPIVEDSSVLFLYRGEAESVSWNGDFNNWGNNDGFHNNGSQIVGTDVWLLKKNFPADARLDYKITINESSWILDPVNPHQQMSGFGPNSELRMSEWKPEPLLFPIQEAAKGSISSHKIISSKSMGYDIQYRVYTPPGYDKFENLPVLYTTDGQEYSSDQLGKTPIILDNLIHLDRIEPVVAVFVEPLNPQNLAENRRATEMGNNEEFLSFFVDELIPEIESSYKVNSEKEARVILGTSLGGLNATYFAFSRPDVFDGAAIQAPAFWYREPIYDLVRNADETPSEMFMSVGTIGDNTPDARKMKQIFEKKELSFSYLEVNEGHSWGAWSAQMDDILIHFFGNRTE